MPALKHMLASILLIAFLAWLLLALILYAYQHKLIYLPDAELVASPADIGLEYEDLALQTDDGLNLHAWFVPAAENSPVLLFFHGNAGNISHRLESIQLFNKMGLSVLIIDYRGYGLSEGTPGEHGSYSDARAAWNYLNNHRNIAANEIIIFGRSLGGGVASWLASEKTPAAVIIESSFTSIIDMASGMYPYMPVRWLCRVNYPSTEHLPRVDAPVLVIHSEEDELIPFHHGQKLYDSAPDPKTFVQIQGGHNDGFLLSEPRYTSDIRGFLEKHEVL